MLLSTGMYHLRNSFQCKTKPGAFFRLIIKRGLKFERQLDVDASTLWHSSYSTVLANCGGAMVPAGDIVYVCYVTVLETSLFS
jgi:hypothetical protein